ncbi:MAG: gamma-glutamylcyclotransferase family protein [Pseudomonadota bacterium]
MQLFFYGTLLDADLRRAILGAAAEQRLVLRPALLPGYRCFRSSHGDYPVLLRRSGGRVKGALATGVDRIGLLRIGHFEGEDYAPAQSLVIGADGRRSMAWIYRASVPEPVERQTWNLRAWQLRSKTRLLPQVKRWAGGFGADSLEDSDLRWHVRRRLRDLADLSED